jgi:hypothetical protein
VIDLAKRYGDVGPSTKGAPPPGKFRSPGARMNSHGELVFDR